MAIVLTPALVLISLFVGCSPMTLVLSPPLLYVIIAASVWYGPPIQT